MSVFINRLLIMKMKVKMKSRSHRYDMNKPRSRHEHKYSKYHKCFSMMMLICTKQHLSNIWSSIHEKVNPFVPNAPFLYTLETSENLTVFSCFQGVEKGCIANECVKKHWSWPNGHIFVDSPSIRCRNSTWKVRRDFIEFERRIYAEIMTSIRRGNFDMDSTFKIGEISMSSPSVFF